MQELDDNALLREYLERDSEPAFAALVHRHIDKVYSVALRHTGNQHQAEEITQAVFVILARKASSFRKSVILEGWLYQTARLTALTHVRSEIRRARREQEAHMQTESNDNESDAWTQIAPLLDAALARLNETDRAAVVMRFFYGKSLREVGAALGANEESARKRINRALEKLRKFFAGRGVDSTAATIAGAISIHSVQSAPAALSKSVAALVIAKNTAASGPTLTLIKGALKTMAWTKTKTAIVAAAIVILAAGTATTVVAERSSRSSRQIAAALLAFHHDWLTNNYHSTKTPLPKLLTDKGDVSAWSAGVLGAYVQYDFQKDGIEWERRYHILRAEYDDYDFQKNSNDWNRNYPILLADTNPTTWVLYEYVEPKDTNLSQMARHHKLASVTGEP